MKRIYIDPELCKACKNCVLACMVQHGGFESMLELDLTDITNEPRNEVVLDDKGNPIPLLCRHCDDPTCLNACMSGALRRDEDTGHITCDKDQCAGCWMCVMSCPYGMIKPAAGTASIALKCEMCSGRDMPRCVENCPTGAITVIEVDLNKGVIK